MAAAADRMVEQQLAGQPLPEGMSQEQAEEMMAMMKPAMRKGFDAMMDQVLAKCDADHDGQLSFEELIDGFVAQIEAEGQKDVELPPEQMAMMQQQVQQLI